MILAILVFYKLFYKLFIHLNTLPTDYWGPAGASEYIGTWEPPYFDQEGSFIKIYVIPVPIQTLLDKKDDKGGGLCVQMDFTRTFVSNAKCNNKYHVWSHFYQILVVLKYHRRVWNNTNISRSINIPKKCQIHPFNVGVYASKNVSVKDIIS